MSKFWIVVGIIFLGLFTFGIYSSQRSAKVEANSMILYFGDTCPHCKEVDEFIQTNDLKSKLPIVEKEVYRNQGNAAQLNQKAKECNLPVDQGIGVPFLYAEGKCFVGTPDIKKYFSEKVGLVVPTEVPVATDSAEPTDKVN